MLATKRREVILAALLERGSLLTHDMSVQLGVSEVTIRNDFEALEKQGRVNRVHGGVTMCEVPLRGFDARITQNVEAKRKIAAAAASLVTDCSTIILDSGTTVLELARHMPIVTDLDVLTPGIHTALALMEVPGVHVHLMGGRIVAQTIATVGSPRQQGIDNQIAHLAFLGAGAIDADQDVVEGLLDVAESKKSLMSVTRKSVLLADSAKWAGTDRYKVANVGYFDIVISDEGLSQANREAVRRTGSKLIIA